MSLSAHVERLLTTGWHPWVRKTSEGEEEVWARYDPCDRRVKVLGRLTAAESELVSTFVAFRDDLAVPVVEEASDDRQAIYNDVKTELGMALGWSDSDDDDARDWRHDLVERVLFLALDNGPTRVEEASDRVLWEGETGYFASDDFTDSHVDQLTLGVPPGSRVRVVLAADQPNEDQPQMMQSIWPSSVGNDRVDLADQPNEKETR